MALSDINAYWCNTGILSLSACSGRKVEDPNHVVLGTLISVAGIDVEAELERHVDRSPSRATPYPEGGESTSRLLETRSPNSANLSNESNGSDIASLLLTNLPMPPETSAFALQDRIVPPQTALEVYRSQQNMTVSVPDVRESKAARLPSTSSQTHWMKLG